jgi:hypothetical protein
MFKSLQSKKRHRTRRNRPSELPSPWRVVLHQEGTIKIEIERPPTIATLRDMLRERVFIGATLAMLFVTTVSVMFYARQARAETFLHPQACLGGWDNPAAAVGWPDVEGGDVHTYSGTNAASVSDTLAEIFCGGFSGDMPLDTKPTALHIEFSWAYVSRQPALQVSTAPVDLATSTSAVLDAAPESVGIATSSEVEAASDTAPTEPIPPSESSEPSTSEDDSALTSSPSTEIVTPENTALPQDAPATEAPPSSVESLVPTPPTPAQETPPSSESPVTLGPPIIQGLMKWLLPRIAYAQEDAASTTATTSVQSEISTSTVSMAQSAVLEISYTLDGSTWYILGTVTKDTFDTRSFAIPLDGIAQWSDLSKLQISVRSLSGLELGDTVYLDGMSLGVVYEDVSASQDWSPQSTTTTEHEYENKNGESQAAAMVGAIGEALGDAIGGLVPEDEEITEEMPTEEVPVGETPPLIIKSVPLPPRLSVRNFSKEIVIDPRATHRCNADPFGIDVSGRSSLFTKVALKKTSDENYEMQIGSLPDGIDVRFENDEYLYQPHSGENTVSLRIRNEEGSRTGNFTVPIIFTEKGKEASSVICQINIVNLQ